MEENTEQDKSEQPSFFKLKRAREQGSVARGMDLGFFTGLGAFVGWFWLFGGGLAERLAIASRRAFVAAPDVLGEGQALGAIIGQMVSAGARPLIFMGLTIFGVVLAFEFFQTGAVFTTKPLNLDFNRLNPAANIKKLFSVRVLIETAKNLCKLAVYGAVTWHVIDQAQGPIALAIAEARGLTAALVSSGFKLVLYFVIAAAVFAAADQGIVRREFLKKMRMSRRELKREVRDREGEPRLKQRRKQLHAEFVKQSQNLKGIRGADVLITNPTHLAIALRYEPGRADAPYVVARGADQVALRLRRLAFIYGVTIIEDRDLARALFWGAQLQQPIPEHCFQKVADVYLTLRGAAQQDPGTAHA